ncbi:RhaT family transporter [Amylibacter marinus]|uniref:RhaT family transporter n=1 Tax=Amylibacter marinus TaxID=1475483 RepID=A0ABQ5VWJ8_9RHOB|nr:DMT family transporter [Amylibacter marinus]GLQ35730.1 RhaT family transporter [Amylibacter marinus]
MTENNTKLGIMLMIATTLVFALQDGISRHLAGEYNVFMVIMVRYWFFAAFVIALTRHQGHSVRTRQIWLQVLRGVLLVGEVYVMVLGFVYLGLVESYALFIAYPLIITALSGPILGEQVGWRRWLAIFVGFLGMLIILQPGRAVFSIHAIFPLSAGLMFALYGLLTRYAARRDTPSTSFFWTGIIGAIVATAIGVFHWQNMSPQDWAWMALLCILASLGHFLLIKCYAVAQASAVQPFAYMQLVFGCILGVSIFGDTLTHTTAIGVAFVVGAGLFTLWRERAAKS